MELKSTIVDDLYKVLTTKTANNRFYEKRSIGFRNEVEFARILKDKKFDTIDPGQFLITSKNKPNEPENTMIYVTVSNDDKSKYNEFYQVIKKLDEIKEMYFLQYKHPDSWSSIQFEVKDEKGNKKESRIMKPEFSVFRFTGDDWESSDMSKVQSEFSESSNMVCAKKENFVGYLNDFTETEVAGIYSNRFFLDVELGGYKKGMMDFDHIVLMNGKFVPVETKEKSPILGNKDPTDERLWSFGWDSRRFAWYFYLRHKIGMNCWYVIREINNKDDRKFVKWKKTDFDRFSRCTSWLAERSGGGGAGTIEAPYAAFEDLELDNNQN